MAHIAIFPQLKTMYKLVVTVLWILYTSIKQTTTTLDSNNKNSSILMWVKLVLFLHFQIKVSQIPCHTTWKAPDDCLQYLTGRSGAFRGFNHPTGYLFCCKHIIWRNLNQTMINDCWLILSYCIWSFTIFWYNCVKRAPKKICNNSENKPKST